MGKELIGLCSTCLGCNKLENPDFTGVYRCNYATSKQLTLEEIQREMRANEQVQK